MLKVGITGNIASGKSEVEKIIVDCNFKVVDLDAITNKIYSCEDFQNELKEKFGTFEKRAISNIVFEDNSKLKILEELIHPIIEKELLDIFREHDEKIIFVSGALLYEAGFDKYFDKIIYVEADADIRLKRLMQRNDISKNEAMKRIKTQQNNSLRADFLIENNSNMIELKKRVIEVLKLL